MARTPTTYWDYIKVEELLALQGGLEADDSSLSNDEVLFIAVHQIDELWLKLVLRELAAARDCFAQEPVPEQALASAARGLRRMALLMQNLAQHFSVMETLTTRDYLAFRDKLTPASGFQSAQLREIEILMGLEASERIPIGHESSYLKALEYADGRPSPALARVERRLRDTPTLKQAVHEWLYRTPIQGSTPADADDADAVRGFITAYCNAQANEVAIMLDHARHEAMSKEDVARLERRFEGEVAGARNFLMATDVPEPERARRSRIRAAVTFIESYRELPLLAWPREILDGIVAVEQAFLIFRQRHARMVERVIGRRTGTGGSAGVDYLDGTALRYRVFNDVWAVRTILMRKGALPPLKSAELYDFQRGQ